MVYPGRNSRGEPHGFQHVPNRLDFYNGIIPGTLTTYQPAFESSAYTIMEHFCRYHEHDCIALVLNFTRRY